MSIKQLVMELCLDFRLDPSRVKQIPVNEADLDIPKEILLTAVNRILKSGIWHLSAITCLQIEGQYILLYNFWQKSGLTLRVNLGDQNLQIDSICALIPGANFYEREAREMFGIEFIGLPNPEPLFLPENWKGGYPMRDTGHDTLETK